MTTTPTPVRVAILNDHPVVVAGLALIMAQDPTRIHVVEVDWRSPIVDDVDADVVLYDVSASGTGDGVGLLDLVNRTRATVVLFADDLDEPAITAAKQAGVTAHISTRVSLEELVHTLETIRSGEHVVSPALEDRRVSALDTGAGRAARLTSREAEVLVLIAHGHTNEQIATSLYLSANSVKTYIRTAYRKIGVQRRVHAVLWAQENGFALTQPAGDPARVLEARTGVRAAVAAALRVFTTATTRTRGLHLDADRRAADLVAHHASQDAAATRYHAEAEATRVRRAAEDAVEAVRRHEADPDGQEARARALEVETTVVETAEALRTRTAALADVVAVMVRERAQEVRVTRARLHRRTHADVALTAVDIETAALAASGPSTR